MSGKISAASPSEDEWDSHEGTIRSLYLLENRKLEGLGGVIDEMRKKYQFSASKAQYERHFKKWGIRKKLTKEDWKIIGQKIEKRKRKYKESVVDIDGDRQPAKKIRKETLRHAMSIFELHNQVSTPRTPPGVKICTPAAMIPINSLHVLVDNLPLSQFKAQFNLRENAMLANHGILPCLVKHFAMGSDQIGSLEHLNAMIRSTMLDTDALSGYSAAEMALISDAPTPTLDFLKTTIFFLSNGFFDGSEDISKKLYGWLNERPNSQLLDYILSLKGPTAEALAEKLFGLAIEAEDVTIVKQLLKRGLDPDQQINALTPLQYSCRLRNPELAQTLIDAGADVNETFRPGQNSALEYALSPGSGLDINSNACELARILLRAGADVNPRNRQKRSPLTLAAEGGSVEAVTLLIAAGADVNSTHGQESPLIASIRRSWSTIDNDDRNIIEKLLRAGADVNLWAENEDFIFGTLDEAVETGILELVQILIARGVHVPQRTLGLAIENDDLDMVKLLLNAGARLDEAILETARGNAGINFVSYLLDTEKDSKLSQEYCSIVLTKAIRDGEADLIAKLADCGTQLSGNQDLAVAIEATARRGDIQVLRWVLETGSSRRATASGWLGASLLDAISNSRVDVVAELLAAGADVNAQKDGRSPLLLAIQQRDAALVRTLLRVGAAVNSEAQLKHSFWSLEDLRTPFTFTVLPAAIMWGDFSIIQDLIQAGADIDGVQGEDKKTALVVAIEKRDHAMVEFLIDAGADINSSYGEFWGPTPLEVATRIGDMDMIRYLLNHGADPSDERALDTAVSSDVELVRLFLEASCSSHVRRRKRYGCSSLQAAVIAKDRLIIETLLTYKIDVNQADRPHRRRNKLRNGDSALGTSIKEDNSQDLWIVRMILHAGGDPNSIVTETPKHTALLAAIEVGKPSLVNLLVDAGAEANPVSIPGVRHTPLQLAADKGNMEILQILLKLGADVNALPAERNGGTALQFAAIGGLVAMAYLLLSEGADVNALPAKFEGRTALEGAAEHGRIDMLQLLLNAGAEFNGTCGEQYARAVSFARKNGHGAARRLLESAHIQWFESVADTLMEEME